MPAKTSAGLLVYRERDGQVEVLLVHPGGPLWKNKDAGAWSIPKGEFGDGEDALAAAKREFHEETGVTIKGAFKPLAPVRQKGGKQVHAFAVQAEIDAAAIKSNTFTMEWPPKSGRMQAFPEIDSAQWFGLDDAREKINAGQAPLLQQLAELLTA